MKAVCCQLDIVWEDKPANYAKVRALLDGIKIPPGSLVILPEMFATGFSMNVVGIREGAASETESFLASAARFYGLLLPAGLFTVGANGQGRKEAVVFSPEGKLLARFCTIPPLTPGGEAQHYAAGTEIVTFDWQGFKVAPFVCYDLRFPEVFRSAARQGANVFVVISNWPVMRIHHLSTLLQARAIENQAYVAGVNRCGTDPKLTYNGRSLLIDPRGDILAELGNQEGLISADLNLDELQAWRQEFPALQDMHPEFVV